MSGLGELYFDVVLKDKTAAGIKQISDKLAAQLSADIGKVVNRGLKDLKIKVKIEGIDKADREIIRLMKEQAKQIMMADKLAISESKVTVQLHKEAEAAAKAAAAESKAAAAKIKAEEAARRATEAKQRGIATTNRATAAEERRALAIQKTGGVIQQVSNLAKTYFSLYAVGSLLGSLVRVRGEFELQLTSLKAILQSSRQAVEMYSKLQSLAVQSPFQFQQLMTYSKMLSAYQIPTKDLYSTTKRLADLSAGLGVDMNRIILAYGQVRAAAVLRGQELRQFTEAGIPMVDALAKKFSELENRVVLTGEVFEKISKREVPFKMVKEVIEDLTSETGIFYNMQEKQAETLHGKVSNLRDSWEIMLNKIGEANEGVLKGGVNGLTWMMNNYEALGRILLDVAAAYGSMKLAAMTRHAIFGKETQSVLQRALAEKRLQAAEMKGMAMMSGMNSYLWDGIRASAKLTQEDYRRLIVEEKLSKGQVGRLFVMGKITAATASYVEKNAEARVRLEQELSTMSRADKLYHRLGVRIAGLANIFSRLGAFLASNVWFLAIAAITEVISEIANMGKETENAFNKVKESAKETIADLDAFFKSNAVQLNLALSGDIEKDQADKLVKSAKEEIEKQIPYGLILANTLIPDSEITDVRERAKMYAEALNSIKEVMQYFNGTEAIRPEIDEDSIIGGAFGEGLAENIEDSYEAFMKLQKVLQEIGISFGEASQKYHELLNITDAQTRLAKFQEVFGTRNEVRTYFENLLDEIKNWRANAQPTIDDIKKALAFFPDEKQKQVLVAQYEQAIIESEEKIQKAGPLQFALRIFIEEQTLGESFSAYERFVDDLDAETIKSLRKTYEESGKISEEMVREAAAKWQKQYADLYGGAVDLVKNISKLTAYIKVRLIEAPELSTFQYQVRDQMQGFIDRNWKGGEIKPNASNKYSGLITDMSNVSGLVEATAQQQKKRHEAIENLKKLNTSTQKDTEAFKDDVKRWQKQQQDSEDFLNAFGMPLTGDTKATGGGKGGRGGGSEEDTIVSALKLRYEALKSAYKEYSDLVKEIGRDNAFKKIKELPGFDKFTKEEFDKYFVTGGGEIITKDTLEKLNALAKMKRPDGGKALESFLERVQKDMRAFEIDDIVEKVKQGIDQIKDALEVGVKQYQKYEKILEQTNNKAIATLFAYGKADALVKNTFDLYKQAIADMGKERGMALSYDTILAMTPEQKSQLPDDIRDVFKKAQQVEVDESGKLADTIVNAIMESMTVEEKTEAIEAKYKKILDDLAKLGIKEDSDVYRSVVAQRDREVMKLQQDLLKTIPLWQELFDKNKEYYSSSQLSEMMRQTKELIDNAKAIKDAKTGKVIGYTSSYKNTEGQDVNVGPMTVEDYNRLTQKLKELFKVTTKSANSFQRLKAVQDRIARNKKFNASTEQMAEDMDDLKKSVADVVGDVSRIASAFGELGSAMGDDALSGAMDFLSSSAGIFQSALTGDWVGAATGVVGFITNLFKQSEQEFKDTLDYIDLLADKAEYTANTISRMMSRLLGDNLVDRLLALYREESKKEWYSDIAEWFQNLFNIPESNVQNFAELFEALGTTIPAVSLGGLYERIKLQQKLEELQKKYKMVRNHSSSTEEEIEQARQAVEDAKAEIEDLTYEVAELFNIDINSWTDNLATALTDAFSQGTDAAKAFDDTINDIFRGIANKMILEQIIRPAFADIQTWLFGADGLGGAFGTDFFLDESEVAHLYQLINALKDTTIPAAQALYDSLNTALGGVLDATDSATGLSASIKGLTEETASLIASYTNAIRSDVAMILLLEQTELPKTSAIAEAQLAQLNVIASNTNRTASASEQLLDALLSVITVTSAGKSIRI